ncbi:hypothetical protein [Rhodococcus erythropolis]|uniref:hypothetical protein n=1 Tax=Rhodococcus erythropolis TaxID=1833 RepID=UPI000A4600A5|nr:hypothetical protein [Rhodococcus erythropolis]
MVGGASLTLWPAFSTSGGGIEAASVYAYVLDDDGAPFGVVELDGQGVGGTVLV